MRRTTDLVRGARSPWPPARRWPWAVGAAVAGALAGGTVAYAARRLEEGPARPGAVDPQQLVAVVDRPEDAPPPAG